MEGPHPGADVSGGGAEGAVEIASKHDIVAPWKLLSILIQSLPERLPGGERGLGRLPGVLVNVQYAHVCGRVTLGGLSLRRHADMQKPPLENGVVPDQGGSAECQGHECRNSGCAQLPRGGD